MELNYVRAHFLVDVSVASKFSSLGINRTLLTPRAFNGRLNKFADKPKALSR